jgi:RNA exonuclease 1
MEGLGFLSALPCPAEQSGVCNNAQCQFRHQVVRRGPAIMSPAASEQLQTSTIDDGSATLDGSSFHNGKQSATKAALPQQPRKPEKRLSVDEQAEAKGPQERAITPPPLKRQRMLASSDKVMPSSTGKESKSQQPSNVEPSHGRSSEQTTTRPAPRKAETLNPRHIPTAPAQHATRHKLLTLLHAEYRRLNAELKSDASADEEKLVLSDQELIWLALDEEERIATSKGSVYASVLKLEIMKYKRMGAAKWQEERLELWKRKEALRIGATAKKLPLGEPKVIETGLTPEQEVAVVRKIITPIDGLTKFGYVAKPPTEPEIEEARKAEVMSGGFEQCDRCSKRFQVFPGRREDDGALTSGGRCTYHWGRAMYQAKKVDDPYGTATRRWTCCGAMQGEDAGCTTAEHHVYKISDPKRLANVLQFQETPENEGVGKDRALAFDCEMSYTTKGLELIRVTATAWPTEEILLDALVHPIGEILDLNSRFSGVWPQDLVGASPYVQKDGRSINGLPTDGKTLLPSPTTARDLFFSLINPTTPLIGHGLENDLNAMRIVHPTIVDTVLLFPHSRGLPARNSLRLLAETHLNLRIQVEERGEDGVVKGHDSAEDARAAGRLVRSKTRDEWARLRGLGWRSENNAIAAP